MARVVVTGVAETDKRLAALPLRVQKSVSRKATRRAAKEIVLPAAKAAAPFDTGELEESLTVRATKSTRTSFGHQVTTRDGMFAGDEFYGAFMEFGTKERQHASGKGVGRIDPAKHGAFMRPAVYDNEARIRSLYLSAVNEALAKVL